MIEVRGGGIRTHFAEMQERVGVADPITKMAFTAEAQGNKNISS